MKHKYLVIGILLLSSFLRLYDVGKTPRGLYIDEPSLGLNAYAILTTGKDEHGVTMPLAFKSFGEYKLPLYIYGSVPIIGIFGASAFSIRLLSALAGIAATYGIYQLTKQIFYEHERGTRRKIGLIAAFLWALSPWNIQLSRGAFESNLMVTMAIFSILFLIRYIETKKTTDLVLWTTTVIAVCYTYNAARLFFPIVVIGAIIIYRKSLLNNKTTVAALSIVVALTPALIGNVRGPESQRLQQVFELGNKEYMLGPIIGTFQKYLVHFSPQFLFFSGDTNTARHSVGELGVLYFPEVMTLAIGVVAVLKMKSKYTPILFLWLLIAPLPAALATPVPHALRASLLLPPLVVLSSYGCYWFTERMQHINSRGIRFGITALIIAGAFYSGITYLHVYYQHYKYRSSWDWNENITLLAEYLTKNKIDTTGSILIEGNPQDIIYIKFLSSSRKFDESKYIFIGKDSQLTAKNGDIVAISGWKGTPSELKNVVELKMLNGSIAYKVGKWQEQ